jgi:LytS/YehU family sensor histidine kinase
MKQYNIKTGVIFSVLIGLLSSFPRLIRSDFDFLIGFAGTFVYIFCGIFVCWLIHHFFLLNTTETGFLKSKLASGLLSILSGVIFMVGFSYVFNITGVMPVSPLANNEITVYHLVSIRLFRAFIISAFTFFVVYYFRMVVTLQRSKLENAYLKQENLKAQIASLREQISPHFLFNSLNTLSSLSQDNKVKEYILRLSEVYRYVLHYQEQNKVMLKDELEFIRAYTYIMESRFEDGLKINIAIPEEKMERKIVPLALQLLIENAIKHNAVSYRKPLVIDIYSEGETLLVENDFRPKETIEKSLGKGLNNLSERYRLIAGKDITITKNELKFKVEIPFLS